jgi:rsbT co-antagonist protein RsbR
MSRSNEHGSGSHAMQAAELLQQYCITDADLARVQELAKAAMPDLEAAIDRWYEWLESQPDYHHFFPDEETQARVREIQDDYWKMFLSARVDEDYLDRRRRVGEVHARIGLPLNSYFAGMNMFSELFNEIANRSCLNAGEKIEVVKSVTKLLHLDTAIVVETYNELVENTLTAQSRSLMEMSTPVTQIWSGILLLPIVGIIDSQRSQDIMNATLTKIGETQARIFILDISGVGVVDTAVANHLIKITRAAALMGCDCTISGLSPAIAQTIVDLGIDVGRVKTTATMRDALADAFRRVGMHISREHNRA